MMNTIRHCLNVRLHDLRPQLSRTYFPLLTTYICLRPFERVLRYTLPQTQLSDVIPCHFIQSPRFYLTIIELAMYLSIYGCHINNVCINHLFYADDLCLMAPSPVGLQLLIDICANYGIENDLLFNRSKSVCMVVKPRCRNVSTPLMFLNGDALEYVDSVKYLGVLLSQDMKDDADMSRHLRSFYARSNVIFRKFHHCSASIKVNLIKT